MDIDFEKLLDDFQKIIEVCELKNIVSEFQLDILQCLHKPSVLPKGKMAVYIFIDHINQDVLKVGKAGPKSNARYLSQHYNPNSSASNLSKSLLNDEGFWVNRNYGKPTEENIGKWIKSNLDRVNVLIPANLDKKILSLLEIYIQCRLNPKYEG